MNDFIKMVNIKNAKDNFEKECNEWLNPLGYSTHFKTADGSRITYQYFENIDKNYPTITCIINDNGKKRCIIDDCRNYKLFLNLTSGEIQFKHPHLEQYLKVFEHYSNLAEKYPVSL